MITSITLQGFKSFADRTRLDFGPGVTAVIGPNGSGKSNVVEALRWVSHQARARELRAARATELIFHGSAGAGDARSGGGKAALGLAEVELELRTLDGQRLHLSRRIYRDGSAEQDIMGRPARARDVQGALRGTGLGSGGLAVIGQGEVGSVVQAEGQTLLAYVQEAAGLSRSVAARLDTEAQLAQAETQLDQVRLLEGELEDRTRRLDAAARAAARHAALSLEQLQWQDALARAKHLAALDELSALRGQAARLALDSQVLAGEVVEAAAALDKARAEVTQARSEQQAHLQGLELYRAAVRAQEQLDQTLEHLERDLTLLRSGLEAGEPAPPPRAAPDLTGLEAELASLVQAQKAAGGRARELESALRQAREQAGRAAQRQAAHDAERRTLQAEAARLAAQLAQEAAALEATRTEEDRLSGLAAGLQQTHAEALQRHAALLERQREAGRALQRIQAELPPLRREQDRLESSLNSYSRYGEGPRNALRSDHPGIVGSVADLLTVPAEHETAVGAALGRRLEQVVVQTADDAREIIDLLKRSGGRATFLPLDLLRPRPRRDAALLREPGVLGNLSDLCPSDPEIVGQQLLSDTLLLDSLAAATALARRHANRPRLVTVEGELLEPGGALTGGRLRDSGAAVLAEQRRFAEVQVELERLHGQQQTLTAELSELSAETEEAAISESVARAALDQTRARGREAALQRTGLQARQQTLDHSLQALQTRLEAAPQDGAPTASVDPAGLEAELAALRTTVETGSQRERTLSAELTAGRELTAAWKAHHAAAGRYAELQDRLGALQERREPLLIQVASLRAETAERQAALGDLQPQAVTEAEARRDASSAAYSGLIARQNRTAAGLEEARLTLARREGSLGSVPDGTLPPGQPREWQARLTAAQVELASLGTVNPVAAQELAAEQERLAQLSAERQDVERAAGDLRQHLGEMDRTEQQATSLALGRVGRAFPSTRASCSAASGSWSSTTVRRAG